MARVLAIDDDALVRRTIETMLAQAGHDVVAAANGREGLRLAGSQRFDVVVVDIFMPDVEGLEVIRRLREHKDPPAIVAMSGATAPTRVGGERADYLKMAESLGAVRTIRKPFQAADIQALVAECLAARKKPD